jgi:hypothetical protein
MPTGLVWHERYACHDAGNAEYGKYQEKERNHCVILFFNRPFAYGCRTSRSEHRKSMQERPLWLSPPLAHRYACFALVNFPAFSEIGLIIGVRFPLS